MKILKAYNVVISLLLSIFSINAIGQNNSIPNKQEIGFYNQPSVYIAELKLLNNSLIPSSVFNKFSADYLNTEVTSQQLLQLTQDLTQYLVAQGYVNSGVILPDQVVKNDTIYLEVIEGSLAAVEIRNSEKMNHDYILNRLSVSKDEAFNINEATEQLRLLQQDPRIENIKASLKPSSERGKAILNIDVNESQYFHYGYSSDNHVSPNVGEFQQSVYLSHINLTGNGDSIYYRFLSAEGLKKSEFSYSYPLNRRNSTLELFYNSSESEIVTEPFRQLNIEGESSELGIRLNHPVYKSLNSEFTVGLGLVNRTVNTFLLGEPFSFSFADDKGEQRTSIFEFSQGWVRRGVDRVISIQSVFSFGLDAFDASVGIEPDGEFTTWRGQGQWLEQLNFLNSVLFLRGEIRVSNDSLPNFEKMSLGGNYSVRGYRENLISRDNGYVFSIEWQVPAARLPIPWLSKNATDGQITLSPFLDYGYGWDYDNSLIPEQKISSVGLEINWQLSKTSFFEFSYGVALQDREFSFSEESIQDDGIHFKLNIGF